MNKNLGIIGEEKGKILKEIELANKQLELSKQYQQDILDGCTWASSKEAIKIASVDHQMGKPMHYLDLEKLIQKLPNGSNYVFFDWLNSVFPELRNRPFKSVYYIPPGKPPVYISSYGKTILPEWSIMKVEEEIIPDLNIRHFDRKDEPRKVWKGWDRGYVQVDPTEISPWKRKIVKTVGEDPENPMSRGWRTVFSRIVGMLLATPSEVEKIISMSDRLSWAVHTGRRNEQYKY